MECGFKLIQDCISAFIKIEQIKVMTIPEPRFEPVTSRIRAKTLYHWLILLCNYIIYVNILHYDLLTLAQQPLVCQGLLFIEASLSQSDTPHSVGLLWTSDQPDTETSIWQLTTDIHPCSTANIVAKRNWNLRQCSWDQQLHRTRD